MNIPNIGIIIVNKISAVWTLTGPSFCSGITGLRFAPHSLQNFPSSILAPIPYNTFNHHIYINMKLIKQKLSKQ